MPTFATMHEGRTGAHIPFLWTAPGNSVCAYVHGFLPYFYIEAPRGFGPDDCDSLCSQLNVRVAFTCCASLVAPSPRMLSLPVNAAQRMLAERNSKGGRQNKFCLSVVMQQRQTIMYYQPVKASNFLRITVAVPNLVTQARGRAFLPTLPQQASCCFLAEAAMLPCLGCRHLGEWAQHGLAAASHVLHNI